MLSRRTSVLRDSIILLNREALAYSQSPEAYFEFLTEIEKFQRNYYLSPLAMDNLYSPQDYVYTHFPGYLYDQHGVTEFSRLIKTLTFFAMKVNQLHADSDNLLRPYLQAILSNAILLTNSLPIPAVLTNLNKTLDQTLKFAVDPLNTDLRTAASLAADDLLKAVQWDAKKTVWAHRLHEDLSYLYIALMCTAFVLEHIAFGLALATPLVIFPAIMAIGTIGFMIHRALYPQSFYPEFYNTEQEKISSNLSTKVAEACGRASQTGMFSLQPGLPQLPTVELDRLQPQPGM